MSQPLTSLAKPSEPLEHEVRPWWKEFYVWMVIAGPVSVILACIVTAFFILRGPDAVVSEDYYREGIALGVEVKDAKPAMQPAQTGRNHSATGGSTNGKQKAP
jgi:uncharacterized protein